MSMLGRGAWNEPDPAVVDELTRWGSFSADHQSIDDIYNKDLTRAQRTGRVVRATIRALLANGLITPNIPEDEIWYISQPPEVQVDAQDT